MGHGVRRALAALVLVVTATGCSTRELRAWVAWHGNDPDAAVEFAQRPEVIADLATGEHESASVPGGADADSSDCYADEFAAAGLPVAAFVHIARRESGCDPWVWVVDRDDDGGALLGFNFKGSMAGYWRSMCGATKASIRGNVALIMDCAAAEYQAHGLAAWR